MESQSLPDAQQVADRIAGAKLVAISVEGEHLRVEFEHKRTDDDAGCFTVPVSAVCFCGLTGDQCDSCWKAFEEAVRDA